MKRALHRFKQYIKSKFNTNHRLVDFIICGTQKGGTSALDVYLRTHPQVCMANKKEVHFFDSEHCFKKENPNYSLYHCSFSPNSSHQVIGEATPIYMYWNNAPQRMWEYNPNLKLIVLLRNPIERAFSHWTMEHSRKAETQTFWDAIRTEKDRCKKALPLQHRVYSYVDRGFYSEQLKRLWECFPRESTLVLKNESLKSSPQETLNEICKFLSIDLLEGIEPKTVFSNKYESGISDQERDYLQGLYADEISALEKLLEWDCSDWR